MGTPHSDQVLAWEEGRRRALLAGDWDAVEAGLPAGLSYGHSTGAVDDKAAYLRKLREGLIRYQMLAFDGLRVTAGPGLALVQGEMRAQVLRAGELRSVASRFLTVWAPDEDGIWRLWAHQGTPHPA